MPRSPCPPFFGTIGPHSASHAHDFALLSDPTTLGRLTIPVTHGMSAEALSVLKMLDDVVEVVPRVDRDALRLRHAKARRVPRLVLQLEDRAHRAPARSRAIP